MIRTDKIDINCDLGEGIAREEQLFPLINSCSIACGGHIGNKDTIARALELAISNEVEVGAHPSYPDPTNFGRISMKLTEAQFKSSVKNQLDLYFSVLKNFQIKNHHIKAHGALYNDLMKDAELGQWFLEVIQLYDYGMIFTPFNGVFALMAREEQLNVKHEAFIDRNYAINGMLVNRKIPGAIIVSSEAVWEQLHTIITMESVKSIDGFTIPMKADTFCIHGDHPGSLKHARFIRAKLVDLER